MTQVLAQICRHPIKGHGRETLASVRLLAGRCLPWDRHWAVAHEAAKLVEGWNRCANFARGAKSPQLMAITSELDELSGCVTLRHPNQGVIRFDPNSAEDLPRFLDWLRPLTPAERAQPKSIVTAGRGMTDNPVESVSIASLSSLADLSATVGQDLSVDRWRANLWIKGAAPWTEFDLIGKKIRIGGSVLEVIERITRCTATTVNPMTGRVDAPTLTALNETYGHQDFGVFAVVIESGPIAVGDEWRLA